MNTETAYPHNERSDVAPVINMRRTEEAIEAWREEAARRIRRDLRSLHLGQPFRGIERDANAAFAVGLMQKHFLALAREAAVEILLFPCISVSAPCTVGIISLDEGRLSESGVSALSMLRCISDSVAENDRDEGGVRRLFFEIRNVWKRYALPGGAYAQWLRMTLG